MTDALKGMGATAPGKDRPIDAMPASNLCINPPSDFGYGLTDPADRPPLRRPFSPLFRLRPDVQVR